MKKEHYIIAIVLILCNTTAFAKGINVAFSDQPISTVVQVISELADYPIAYTPVEESNQKLTWKQTNMSQKELMTNFKAIAESLGYSVKRIDTSKPYYIVDHSAGYLSNTTYSSVGVYQVHNVTVEEIQETAAILYAERLNVGIHKDNGIVVYSGSSETVKTFNNLLPKIDVILDGTVESVRLKYVSVSEGLRALKDMKILENDTFYPDYWGHSIIVNGSKKDKILARSALKAIDVEKNGYVDRVYHLHSTQSDNVVDVLSAVYPDCHIRKISDKSLLISGESRNVEKAEILLTQIDGTGVQVRVEAVIAYLTDRQFKELGLNLAARNTGNFFSKMDTSLTVAAGDVLQDYVKILAGIELNAEKSNSDGSIVSAPTLTVLNGHKAKLQVGRNVPYLSEAVVDDDGDTTGTSIERKDVGLTFEITPTVAPDGDFVNVSVRNIISNITAESELGQTFVDAVFDNQEISSDVLIANGETIFLGGLKADEVGSSTSYIPVLSQIPFIGDYLFTYDVERKEKRNLVVSLRVNIIGG